MLYGINHEMPSKVAFDPEEPSFGRIRANSVAPPHCPTSIKRCISKVEGDTGFAWHADLFEDTSCNTPLEEGHISILPTDGPGLSPNEPMVIVLRPPIPDGRYIIKNRASSIYWLAEDKCLRNKVYFDFDTIEDAKARKSKQVKSILQLYISD